MDDPKRPTLISLFSGAGGLDIGLEQAGFETVAASDWEDDCVATLRANKEKAVAIAGRPGDCYLANAAILKADVADLAGDELRPSGSPSAWRPDLLAGGPPCQPFSSSGAQRSVLDTRGRLFEHFVRLADVLRPRLVLFENVRGLVTARGASGMPGEVLQLVRSAFEEIGYATRFALLNAADFGCPQRRVRLFMLASQDLQLPEFPAATHSREPVRDLFVSTRKWVSLGEFLALRESPSPDEIVRPSPNLMPLMADLAPGSGLKSPGRKEATRPGGHWGYKQGTFLADPEQPARTVTASSSQDWVRDKDGSLRRLSFSECASLQGFPADWEFVGSKTSRFRQVGNGVPSVFGKVIGQCIAAVLSQSAPTSGPQSAPLPEYMHAAIRYTHRDHERNRASRTRASLLLAER